MDDMMDGNNIYEPLRAYKNVYKDLFNQNAAEYFNDLVLKSGIDIEANRAKNREIANTKNKLNALLKELNSKNGLKGFLIFLVVAGFISLAIGTLMWGGNILSSLLIPILMTFLGLALGVSLLIVIIKVINPLLKKISADKVTLEASVQKLISEAWAQIKPLNDLFSDFMNVDIFRKTLPIINMDQMFDSKRLEYLVNKFGLPNTDDINRSTLYVQSGDIVGNPFFFARERVHEMGTKVYTGTRTIFWTSRTYSGGKMVTVTHSQVLTAHLSKPCPYWHNETYLVYGNEAAPNLIFSRTDSNAENMSEKEIDKTVAREEKALIKLARDSLKKGGNFTVMGNAEFDVLFGAKNRNNELEFRLLFTPLAQKQLLDLMKDKTIGYGDDFNFYKNKMINVIEPQHLSGANLALSANNFKNYDYDACLTNFLILNNSYFKNVFFSFAPLLSIPLYQQQKPHEYIYKGMYDSYVSFYEHEKVANMINESQFKHPLSTTLNILKTTTVKSGDYMDSVKVTAYGYETRTRVETVMVPGRDGGLHAVPVTWIEYLPVDKETDIDISAIEDEKVETWADKFKKAFEDLKNKNIDKEDTEILTAGLFLVQVHKNDNKNE
jgi:hypothetical protein